MGGGPMGMFGGPPRVIKRRGPDGPREDESHEDIMARMNKISDEIGERSEKRK